MCDDGDDEGQIFRTWELAAKGEARTRATVQTLDRAHHSLTWNRRYTQARTDVGPASTSCRCRCVCRCGWAADGSWRELRLETGSVACARRERNAPLGWAAAWTRWVVSTLDGGRVVCAVRCQARGVVVVVVVVDVVGCEEGRTDGRVLFVGRAGKGVLDWCRGKGNVNGMRWGPWNLGRGKYGEKRQEQGLVRVRVKGRCRGCREVGSGSCTNKARITKTLDVLLLFVPA